MPPHPPPQACYLEDLAAGQRYAGGTVAVDAAGIKAFAAAFDPQPFHLDEQAAKASIFGRLVASGWHTMAPDHADAGRGRAPFALGPGGPRRRRAAMAETGVPRRRARRRVGGARGAPIVLQARPGHGPPSGHDPESAKGGRADAHHHDPGTPAASCRSTRVVKAPVR